APRWLARGSDGTFWSMPTRFRWRLEHWDSIGKLLSTVERRPAWFTPYARDMAPDGNHPPEPVIRGFWLGPLDRLWVLGEVADRTWRTGLASHLPGSAEVISDPDKVFDSVIESVDLRSGASAAEAHFDPAYDGVAGAGTVVRVGLTTSGWKRVELFAVKFDGKH
ncbi:MAG: hypothetical protein ACREK8_01860, partial [Gemmatimonadales bacterium]